MLMSRIFNNLWKREIQTGLRFNPGIWLLSILVVAGCAMVGPDYVKPTAQEAEDWLESEEPQIKSEDADFSQWWTVFNDPILNRLIESAYQQNYTLQSAGIRILEARAQLGIAVGSQYPQTQRATGDAAAQKTSKNVPNARGAERFAYVYDTGFDAAWELDIWGKFRRAVQSGMANLEATIANYDDILVTLTSEVARTYVVLRTSEERLAVARENVRIQDRSL
jgi:outer membrane protein TolC